MRELKVGIFTALYAEKPLDDVMSYVSSLGYEAVELPAWRGSLHVDLDSVLSGGASSIKALAKKHGLAISAIAIHADSQLVLGPLGRSTDGVFQGTPEEKVSYGVERAKKAAEAAALLDVPVVTGFVGAADWSQWYVYPAPNEELFEEQLRLFAERWGDIMDVYAAHGVRFAHEVHPQEVIYNTYTARRALQLMNRKEFGFNLDPSHLVWQGIDVVRFVHEFGDRIYHVHAKDVELVRDAVPEDGLLSTGSWTRRGRGVRFRVPGWGDVPWKRLMTALVEVGYDYVMSYEHEDPVMSREDGCEKAIAYLKPLIIRHPLEKTWW